MAIRKYKPITAGLRGASVSAFDELTNDMPHRSLVKTIDEACHL